MNATTAPVPKTATIAVWSLVLAILGVFLIGPLGSIPAVICGHKAFGRIKRASGALAGQGLALAGLIIGYIGLAVQLMICVMILLLLPAVAAARGEARKTVCRSNLRQIGLAAAMYMSDNRSGPQDFQVLVKNGYVNGGDVFVCPSTGHKPGELTGVDSWTDYALVANHKESDPPDAVMAFTKPECYPGGGGNVLFLDGSVKWCPREDYSRLTKDYLGRSP